MWYFKPSFLFSAFAFLPLYTANTVKQKFFQEDSRTFVEVLCYSILLCQIKHTVEIFLRGVQNHVESWTLREWIPHHKARERKREKENEQDRIRHHSHDHRSLLFARRGWKISSFIRFPTFCFFVFFLQLVVIGFTASVQPLPLSLSPPPEVFLFIRTFSATSKILSVPVQWLETRLHSPDCSSRMTGGW